MSSVREFQLSTTRFEKVFARIFKRDRFLKSFNEWPRVVVYLLSVNSYSLFILSTPCIILYTWIISVLSLLYSKDDNPSAFNLSGYVRCCIHFTSLVARLCTFSIKILSFLNMGDQIVEAYSRCGLTTDLYRFKNISLYIKMNVRKIKPTFLLALFTLLFICSMNFNDDSNVTPKSFSVVTFSTLFRPASVSIVYSKFIS